MKNKIAIIVSGGNILNITSTLDLDIVIIDHDNISQDVCDIDVTNKNLYKLDINEPDSICNHKKIDELVESELNKYKGILNKLND